VNKYAADVKRYRMTYDIHTHTKFSHGKGTIEENVKAALKKGLLTIGISDHGPGHLFYGVRRRNIAKMRSEINRLKPLYPDIDILLGVEANIINDTGCLDLSLKEMDCFDYILAGYHYGVLGQKAISAMKIHSLNILWESFGKSDHWKIKDVNTELVVKAILTNRIKVLTHPGDKGPFDLMEIARACEKMGTMIEVSNWHLAPTTDELKMLAKTGVDFIISSDAHSPKKVGTFEAGLKRLLEAGIDPVRIDNLEVV
jgi:putative hydrolase